MKKQHKSHTGNLEAIAQERNEGINPEMQVRYICAI
jgi:hypothetical protein